MPRRKERHNITEFLKKKGGEETPNKSRNKKSPSPKHNSDVGMCNLDTVLEMEWEQTVVLTLEQVARLMVMKEKAIRIWRAKLQQRVFKEGLATKQETECNLAVFGS